MIKGIHHVALVVRDLKAAQAYYGAVAGLLPLDSSEAEAIAGLQRLHAGPISAPFKSSLLAGRNGYLLLLAPSWPGPAPAAVANPINRAGIRHFCAQNHDCAELAQAVAAQGGSLIAPPLDLGTGNQYAYARDAEGNIMEIEGLPYAPVGEPTWLAHVALVTRDMDQAVAFYSGLFGATLNSRGRFGPGPQFDRMGGLVDAELEGAWLPAGNLQLEFWQFHAPLSAAEPELRERFDPGFSSLCLESDDLDVDAARLVELGGIVLEAIAEFGDYRSVLASDPEGNLVQLFELHAAGAGLSIAALADPEICARVEAGR
jgi:predicted enzyme related to lactoylglutathione lyase